MNDLIEKLLDLGYTVDTLSNEDLVRLSEQLGEEDDSEEDSLILG